MRRDAGQVVAGNAVTHIDKYIATSRGILAGAFFLVLCLGGQYRPNVG
ncbi:hypothetical protein AVMA1855_03790 [Acidovorax sp. SUPP1855]|nr:hypothetical protein [Acidovorax sp. SUPP1855]GKS83232.1 hypothetical protein AVMA1855_03790 [Acidovorax sp. SUPP1855]